MDSRPSVDRPAKNIELESLLSLDVYESLQHTMQAQMLIIDHWLTQPRTLSHFWRCHGWDWVQGQWGRRHMSFCKFWIQKGNCDHERGRAQRTLYVGMCFVVESNKYFLASSHFSLVWISPYVSVGSPTPVQMSYPFAMLQGWNIPPSANIWHKTFITSKATTEADLPWEMGVVMSLALNLCIPSYRVRQLKT